MRGAPLGATFLIMTIVVLLVTVEGTKRRWDSTPDALLAGARIGVIYALCLAVISLLFLWAGW